MKSQQYGCIHMTYKVTTPVDMWTSWELQEKLHKISSLDEEPQAMDGCWEEENAFFSMYKFAYRLSNPKSLALNTYTYEEW